ncbi:hypothetical protein BV898_04767 [Hypsibius exemplaris]|uniref:Uncharacterized protein n=1 Tax=Hypsibius exemplaris TaxID=2072580 RepID=A0A1W0X1G1_HYPEX|nr:hypothetical protein BV898_04767 [Hypsibius exemplaris]
MAGYSEDTGFYPSSYAWTDPAAGSQDPNNAPPNAGPNAGPSTMYNPMAYGGSPSNTAYMYSQQNNMASQQFNAVAGTMGDDIANEPPLLEELGINFDHIVQKNQNT